MSLALDLHPVLSRRLNEWVLGYTRLAVENDGWAHCVRAASCRKQLPNDCEFEFYFDQGSERAIEDNIGSITWATAGELLSVPLVTPDDEEEVVLLPGTKAALAYLAQLNPETPVILYFH